MERRWISARAAVAGRRRTSRAVLAVDVLAAAPLLSATTLAAAIGMSVKNAIALLDGFLAAGIVVEVTHRAKRRLFGLAGLAPLRDQVAPPRRPEPGRGRGRPPIQDVAAETTVTAAAAAARPDRAAQPRLQRSRALDGAFRPGGPDDAPRARAAGAGFAHVTAGTRAGRIAGTV